MNKKNLIRFLLAASCTAAAFIAGCFPKDSLQWSKDGSKGIYSKAGALFVVDGNTGSLTQVAPKETTTTWPAISPDGAHIAFGQIIKADNLNDGLKQLPPTQVKLIETHAEILKQKILAEGIKDGNFPFIGKPVATNNGPKDSFNEQHVVWVQRYLIENADTRLADKIGPGLIDKTKSRGLTYFRLVYAPTADPNNRKILATNEQTLWRISFSPDSRLIAFGQDRIYGSAWDIGYDLYIVSLTENLAPAFIAPAIAFGYDFKSDSRAIAYIQPENEFIEAQKFPLGLLVERSLIDPNGKFLAAFEHLDGNDSAKMYVCTGPAAELAGLLYHPWMRVSYAAQDRIFFASVKVSLPYDISVEEKTTVFCYDLLTHAVSEIMPQDYLDFSQGNLYLFSPSDDSRKMLIQGKKNTLLLYALGPDLFSSKAIIDTNESLGKDDSPPKLVAQWKGPNTFSCLVSEKSHFLTQDPNTPHRRKEIVILDVNNNLKQVLSKDWPDELLDY
jgi:Tol biopolymer transport system component